VAIDVKLEPGWLIKDVQKASDKVKEWSKFRTVGSGPELKEKNHSAGHSVIGRKQPVKRR
jgi:hypothetical protein